MAISYHEDVVAGTPWVIGGVLYHANDQLLDVTNCSLAWSLLSAAGRKTTSAAEPSSIIASVLKLRIRHGRLESQTPGRKRVTLTQPLSSLHPAPMGPFYALEVRKAAAAAAPGVSLNSRSV